MPTFQAFLHEPARSLPVCGDYDVIVVGGGIAGVAAAVAAARTRARVCLLERYCNLGGLATIGNVIVYLPLCDGRGHQLCGGLAEELLRLSVAGLDRPRPEVCVLGVPEVWNRPASCEERAKERFATGFNPVQLMLRLEELLRKNKVKIMYDTRFCDVVKERKRITAVIIENKDGRSALRCRAVVDASGDADVCAAAGERTVSLRTNVPCGWFYSVDDGTFRLHEFSSPFKSDGSRHPTVKHQYSGVKAQDVTAQMLESRQMIARELTKLSADGQHDIWPACLPTYPCFRMTRRLVAATTLCPEDDHRWFEDTVGMTGDWRKAGPAFCIPLSCLAGVKTGNLLVAGRCLSSTGDTWDVTRVIPTCAVSGEAAGVAAAMLALDGLSSTMDIDLYLLQRTLTGRHVIIDNALLKA
jgi:hypothetical protein